MGIFKSEKGQSMLEFAFTFMLLLILVIGILEFGWLMGNKLLATHASREGARYAAVHHDESNWEDNTKSVVASSLVINASSYENYSVNVTKKTSVLLGDHVEVTVYYEVRHFSKMFIGIVQDPFPINAKTVMRQE